MDYALIKNGVVDNIIVADPTFVEKYQQDWDAIQVIEGIVGIGWTWDGENFNPPLVNTDPLVELPEVVITGVTVDVDHADRSQISPDFYSLKLPLGASVTINAELQFQGQKIQNFNSEFAMPMRSTDGLLRHLDVKFVDGAATFSASMIDSKRYEVTQELINSNLPKEMHMQFADISITAVE